MHIICIEKLWPVRMPSFQQWLSLRFEIMSFILFVLFSWWFFFFLTVELIHFERFRDMKALPTEILCQDMTDEVSADTIQTLQSQSMTQSLGKRIKCAWRHM